MFLARKGKYEKAALMIFLHDTVSFVNVIAPVLSSFYHSVLARLDVILETVSVSAVSLFWSLVRTPLNCMKGHILKGVLNLIYSCIHKKDEWIECNHIPLVARVGRGVMLQRTSGACCSSAKMLFPEEATSSYCTGSPA